MVEEEEGHSLLEMATFVSFLLVTGTVREICDVSLVMVTFGISWEKVTYDVRGTFDSSSLVPRQDWGTLAVVMEV